MMEMLIPLNGLLIMMYVEGNSSAHRILVEALSTAAMKPPVAFLLVNKTVSQFFQGYKHFLISLVVINLEMIS